MNDIFDEGNRRPMSRTDVVDSSEDISRKSSSKEDKKSVKADHPRVSSVHFSSNHDEWSTPQWLFDSLNREFGFTLDPSANHVNAKCKKHFTQKEDGLIQDWSDEIVFMNPPYGRQIGR